MLAANTFLQERYLIVRRLGQGGMGTVYEALDQRLSSMVALKETMVETDEMRRAFEREAALLANLRHSALPKVIDYFTEGNAQYLVMEFIPGNDLAELLALRGRAFAADEVLRWADVILNALEHLHMRSPPIIHRDIKPGNLKLTKEGELFLLDFGLAKGAAGQMATLNTSRSVVGYTPVYSPLEQINGTGTDQRSDIYSLGATLYHLITGVVPKDALGRATAVMNGEPDPLRPAHFVNREVPEAVSRLLMRAMEQKRLERPSSATEFRALLREAARQEHGIADVIPYAPTIASVPPAQKKDDEAARQRSQRDEAVIGPVERGAAPSTHGYAQQNTAGDTIVSTGPIRPPALHDSFASQPNWPAEQRKAPVAWLVTGAAMVLLIVSVVGFSLWGMSREGEEVQSDPVGKPSPAVKSSSGMHTSANEKSNANNANSNANSYNTNSNATNSYANSNSSTANTSANRPVRNTNKVATANKPRPRRRPRTTYDEGEY